MPETFPTTPRVPLAVRFSALAVGFAATIVATVAVATSTGWVGGFDPQPVAIVQAGTKPARVWTRAFVDRQILAHVRLTTTQLRDTPAALIVWPEHAVPAYPDRDPALRHLLGEVARRHRADLLFGAPRSAGGTVYNSVRLVDPSGHERGHYDKQRPVLLAESNPFAPADVLADDGNPTRFGAGTEATVLSSFVKLAPSVCHEVLPGARPRRRRGPCRSARQCLQ